jgi:hypothetical protein
MYGLILDFYWYGGENPVTVSAFASSPEELKQIPDIDPGTAADNWPRSAVVPHEALQVRSRISGNLLNAHICTRSDA